MWPVAKPMLPLLRDAAAFGRICGAGLVLVRVGHAIVQVAP